MPPSAVVAFKIGAKSLPDLSHRPVCLQVHFLVFDASPEPFDKNIVYPAPLTVRADPDTISSQHIRKGLRGKLAVLVGVEDLRRTKGRKRFFQRFQAEGNVQGVGESPCQHPAAGPVHDGHKITKASGHRQISNFRRPDVVGAHDLLVPQQIGIYLMRRMWL